MHDRLIAELDLDAYWWPIARLGEALDLLARRGGLLTDAGNAAALPPLPMDDKVDGMAIARWLDWAATRLGIEAAAVEVAAASLDKMLLGGPAVMLHETPDGQGFLALAGRRGDRPVLLCPDLKARPVAPAPLRRALMTGFEAPLGPEIERLVSLAGISPERSEKVVASMLRDRLADTRIGGTYLLRLPAGAPMPRQLALAGGWRTLGAVVAVFAAAYALEIAGWGLVGAGALSGRLDFGWLAAWAAVLATTVALRVIGGWLEGDFALAVGAVLKRRLLAGALALRPDWIKRGGVGDVIGRVIESQALEALSFSGGLSVMTALLELAFAAWILSRGAAPTLHLVMLGATAGAALVLGWRYHRRLRRWSLDRLRMTNDLIEAMVGHRTRLAQEHAERRESREDATLVTYLGSSASMDRAGLGGVTMLPSAWMLAGIAGLVAAAGGTAPTVAALAISLGGLFLAQRGLAGIAFGLSGLARAAVAWEQVGVVFRAARVSGHTSASLPGFCDGRTASGPLLQASGLSFRHAGSDRRVIDGADLTVASGERILLQGPSGGGKSTLAALLTGLERPESGLLMLGGLDRPTLGAGWHRLATAAPQFHDNHILSGTLGFNLLMGRDWPASPADLAEARTLCEELGLGDLLARMPGGINQRIGETGWQLSHGERSRIFLARALLQGAPLVIMDESFAALDPETLERCLDTAMRRADTLVVIAHP